ncbi:MAG TPA: cation transporter [Caulobacteraceae bacterium]|nr:cation transporter [Caulobacteraceae bacterium]
MPGFRRTALVVALANLTYFGVEFAVAIGIGSVALFADSIDFLEDASVNLLIVVALGWSARRRGAVGTVLAAALLTPAAATLWTAWHKLAKPVAPAPAPLALTALGALAVNFSCALLLARHRRQHGSLSRAAFLSARNDVLANLAIIGAGAVTAFAIRNAWPDLVVGLAIAVLNADAAREVFMAARKERRAPAS